MSQHNEAMPAKMAEKEQPRGRKRKSGARNPAKRVLQGAGSDESFLCFQEVECWVLLLADLCPPNS